MNYWSNLKSHCLLLVWLWFPEEPLRYDFVKHKHYNSFFLSPVQNNYVGRIEWVSHVAVGPLWANNISKDVLTPSCLDVSELQIRFPPPSWPVTSLTCVLLGGVNPAQRIRLPDDPLAEHVPQSAPPPSCISWLAWINCGQLDRAERELRGGGGVCEVLTMRCCLHHDPSVSVHTILSVVKLWDLFLLFNCWQMFPPHCPCLHLFHSLSHVGPWCFQNSSGNFWDGVPDVVLVNSHHHLVRASSHPSAVPLCMDCQDSAGLEVILLLMKHLADFKHSCNLWSASGFSSVSVGLGLRLTELYLVGVACLCVAVSLCALLCPAEDRLWRIVFCWVRFFGNERRVIAQKMKESVGLVTHQQKS